MNDQELAAKLASLRILSLDTDGVLTDGGLYYTETGAEMRKFNVKDGLGIKLAMEAGVAVTIITASKTEAIAHRARVLGIEHVYLATEKKLEKLTALADEMGVPMSAIAHVGDDMNDLPLLEAVGCPMTVADAIDAAKDVACYVTKLNGGQGAVREICDMIVAAKNAG